jgi:CRISPR-associated protein Cas1
MPHLSRDNTALPTANSDPSDDTAWAERCGHWLNRPIRKRGPGRRPRQRHEPLVLTGHGIRLRIDNGALVVRDGFTHYPQALKQWRFFPGASNLPSRIVVLDGNGGLSFDVMDWLAEQHIPLVRIDWRGNVVTTISGVYGLNPKHAQAQLTALANGRTVPIAIGFIQQKLQRSAETLRTLPQSGARDRGIRKQEEEIQGLKWDPPRSIEKLLEIEGRAAYSYFAAWQALPLKWKGLGRRPIPEDWHQVGPRTSGRNKIGTNRNATHPVNAILNYAYAVLESRVRTQIVADGYDPTIGFLHTHSVDRPALVFDFMEPLRPIVDRQILEFVQAHTFHPADFTIRSDGVCRLNPEVTRHVVRIILDSQISAGEIYGRNRAATARTATSGRQKCRD